MTSKKLYLTDGVYAQKGAYLGEVVLTTENGMEVTNRIVLEPAALQLLTGWHERWVEEGA